MPGTDTSFWSHDSPAGRLAVRSLRQGENLRHGGPCSRPQGSWEGRPEAQRPTLFPAHVTGLHTKKILYWVHQEAVVPSGTCQVYYGDEVDQDSGPDSEGQAMKLTYFRVKSGADYFHPVTDIRAKAELNANER